ncbi:MAG: TetR/AcrR family transcriptional regulator [Bacteroidota bacterium]
MPRSKQFDEQTVLHRAKELFWKQGYHATSIQNLVEHIGINRASLYDTFKGKEALFTRAFEVYRQESLQQMRDFLDQQASVLEGLRKFYYASVFETLDDADKKGCFAVNCTTELLPGDPVILNSLLKNREDFEAFMMTYLEKGVQKGEISPKRNLADLAVLLFTLSNGLQVLAKLSPPKAELQAVIDLGLSALRTDE